MAESFGEIYHLRWNIETAYQILKDRLQMENFTGTKPVLLEQDIYSTIYVSNIAEDIARDIEQEQADHQPFMKCSFIFLFRFMQADADKTLLIGPDLHKLFLGFRRF